MSPFERHANLLAAFHHRYGITPDYEAILEATYRRLINPGDLVIDIGAHTGRHTVAFAELVGPHGTVHAFEPLPFAFDLLKNRGLGQNVCLHQMALSDRNGVVPFTYAQGAPEESGLREKIYNQPHLVRTKEIRVEVMCLDDFGTQFQRVDFIKIDAEGAEVSCLKGARKLLAKYRPFLSIEYGYPSYSAHGLTNMSLYSEAEHNGYRISDLFGELCRDEDEWSAVCDRAYWDWCLVPKERVSEWSQKISVSPGARPAATDARVAILEAELAALRASTSWKMTAPLRYVVNAIRQKS